MSLAARIGVNTNYTRSINLERDLESCGQGHPYILTARALQTLQRIANASHGREAPRAWALIGPYGAGKSAFALFTSDLVGNPASPATQSARNALWKQQPDLAQRLGNAIGAGPGFCVVALTGSPEPFAQRFAHALTQGATSFFRGRPGPQPKIIGKLRAAENNPSATEIVTLVGALQSAVARAGGTGVLVCVDELGKFLEYQARHRDAGDIFLLQTLAEHAMSASEAPLYLITLLHQSFELYAQGMGERLKNEWKKVQGRFESIPFVESTEQTIRIVAAAINQEFDVAMRNHVAVQARVASERLAASGALPGGLEKTAAAELLARCYPLHPITLLMLPTLCQRVAQNERTLFSYLGSHEPHGFLESLARMDSSGALTPWILPSEIYDYFILNQPGLVADPLTHRRWAEVVTALDRLGDAPEPERRLLKTVGLLNIIGAQGGLKASSDVLSLCGDQDLRKATRGTEKNLAGLQERSIITYRKYSGEYRVWQGSDFDLEAAVREQKAQLSGIDVAVSLNELQPLSPIVARRHAISSGHLRYFRPIFVSPDTLGHIQATSSPTAFLCLAETLDQADGYRDRLLSLGQTHSLGVICNNGANLRAATTDVLALKRVQRDSSELANDPVAQREVKDRLAIAQRDQQGLVAAILEQPGRFEWVLNGASEPVSNKRVLQVRLSALLDSVYSSSPRIQNELINRDKPSSSAMAGRNKLLLAMLQHAEVEDLSIEKFPAEKAMYRAVLRATGLHSHQGPGRWVFQPPPVGRTDVYRMRPTWDAIIGALDGEENNPVTVATLMERLALGLKAGVIPVLLVAVYQALSDEIAIYENGQYIPFLTQEILERMLKDPRVFAMQRFRLDSIRQELYRGYAKAITGQIPNEANLISVIKPLAHFMVGLPDYTKRTKRLSNTAIALRDLFFAAKSPVQLIFTDLPKVCQVEFRAGIDASPQLELFSKRLSAAILELRVAYHALLNELTERLKKAFSIDSKLGLHEVRNVLRGRFIGLERYTIDHQGLVAFINRITDLHGDESQWLVSVASFLARKPPEKWSDDDVSSVQYRLAEYAGRVHDLRRLQLHYEGEKAGRAGDLEAALVRVVTTSGGECEGVVAIDGSSRAMVQSHCQEFRQALENKVPSELRLAVVALLAEGLLERREERSDGKEIRKEVSTGEPR